MTVLMTDSDTDLTLEEARKYGYHMISMPYSIDGETVYPYRDYETFDAHAFYDQLRAGALPNTGAISPEAYIDYIEPIFKEGNDILYVSFSAAMTATFDNLDRALEQLRTGYPDRHLWRIDTRGITLGSLNIVKEVGDLFLAGKSVEEILAWAEEEVGHFATYFYADNLKFFQHSGRVSGLSAVMGTLLGIRPIITINDEGKMVSIGKEKGRQKALERLVQYVKDLGSDLENHRIIVGHTDSQEIAEQLISMLRTSLPNGENLRIELAVTNPTAGSHCGPDGVGVNFHAVHR